MSITIIGNHQHCYSTIIISSSYHHIIIYYHIYIIYIIYTYYLRRALQTQATLRWCVLMHQSGGIHALLVLSVWHDYVSCCSVLQACCCRYVNKVFECSTQQDAQEFIAPYMQHCGTKPSLSAIWSWLLHACCSTRQWPVNPSAYQLYEHCGCITMCPAAPSCRLAAADTITKYLDAAPKKELENILQLICNIFKVENALIALFGDRRIYILNTVGGFKVGWMSTTMWQLSFGKDSI